MVRSMMMAEMRRWVSWDVVRRLDHPTGYPDPLKPGLTVDARVLTVNYVS